MDHKDNKYFWKNKTLEEMSQEEWESLCDGCGRCCLVKLEDEDTGEIYHTKLTCHLLNTDTCRCTDYQNRLERVPDCLQVTPEIAGNCEWLPKTCAYRLVAEGKDLYWWHPLISGEQDTVHEVGISLKDWAMNEKKAKQPYLFYIIEDDFLFTDAD